MACDLIHAYIDTGLPIPDWSDPEALKKVASQTLRCRCWTKGAPLWEIILLDNVPVSHLPNNSNNGSLFIFRFHHVLMDGYGTFKVLMQLFAKLDNVKDSVTPGMRVQALTYDGKMTWGKLQEMCNAPFKLAELCLPTLASPLAVTPIFKGKHVIYLLGA